MLQWFNKRVYMHVILHWCRWTKTSKHWAAKSRLILESTLKQGGVSI